jgi:hypothetical protein
MKINEAKKILNKYQELAKRLNFDANKRKPLRGRVFKLNSVSVEIINSLTDLGALVILEGNRK